MTEPPATPVSRPLSGAALQAWSQLARLDRPGQHSAAILALLLTPGSARELQAWSEETRATIDAPALRALVQRLPSASHLPVLDRLLDLCSTGSLPERRDLLASARRVMCADGRVLPLDRLRWLLLRHRLSQPRTAHRGGARETNELTGLPLAMRQAVARLSAYLARLVPQQPTGDALVTAAGAAWYADVIQALWGDAPSPPPCQPPDADGLGRCLHQVQELAWMRRPLLARVWVDAAMPAWSPRSDATDPLHGAEALRIACSLLDTPLPPALARRFIEPPALGDTR